MPANRRYTPSADASTKALRQLLAAGGIDGALLVQPSFLGTDNRYLLSALAEKDGNTKLRGVCVLPLSADAAQIAPLARAGVVGARLNIIGRPAPDLRAAEWRRFLTQLNKFNWHLEICAEGAKLASMLPVAAAHCRRIVVDHFGLPDSSAPLQCPGWKALMSLPTEQVWVKVSAPYRVFPAEPLRRAAGRCEELAAVLRGHFGARKLIWGSDWPWTRHETGMTYSRTLQWRSLWLDGAEDGAEELILGK